MKKMDAWDWMALDPTEVLLFPKLHFQIAFSSRELATMSRDMETGSAGEN